MISCIAVRASPSTGSDSDWSGTVSHGTVGGMARAEVQETVRSLASAFGNGTFTTDQAEEAGIPGHRIASAVRTGDVLRLWRGHYAVAGGSIAAVIPGLSPLQSARVRHAMSRLRGAPVALGDATAVHVWGVSVWEVPVPSVPLLLVADDVGVRSGVHYGVRFVRRAVDPQRIVTGPGGVPITDPLLASIHVSAAASLSPGSRLVALNAGMRRHLEWQEATVGMPDDAREAAEMRSPSHVIAQWASDPVTRQRILEEAVGAARVADVRGRRRVIESLAEADPRLETALESLSWAAFLDAGITLPHPQVSVRGMSGVLWRVDFLFAERVIGECDGAVKYADPQALWREKKRQEDLEQAGYIVVRWTWEEIVHRPWIVIRRILNAIERAQRLPSSA